MASQQVPRASEDVRKKELRAEEAARVAADELRDVNKQRGAAAEVAVNQRERPNENRSGIIGSIFQTVTGTLGGAKDAVTGKTHESTEKATMVSREAADRERQNEQDARRKAEKYKDSASRKTGDIKDYTAQKSGEVADKTGEYKDYTAQKAKEAKDTTMEKMGEYKDYAAEKSKETADASARKAKEAKDATMEKMGEYKDYTAEKAKEAKDYTADKSREGKDSAVGKLTELKDKAMDFFSGSGKKEGTMSESGDFAKGIADEEAKRKLETMHLKDQGYEARGTRMDIDSDSRGRDVVATVREVDPVRDTAETFRRADQMSGQTFNDVGGMDDYDDTKGGSGGVYRVQLKRENK